MKQFILILSILTFQIATFAQQDVVAVSNVSNNTEIESLKAKQDLKVYPNPTKIQKVTLEMPDDQMMEIRLVNIVGKEVLKKNFEFGTNKYQLKFQDIPKGIYLLQVKTMNNRAVVKKLLVSDN